MLAVAVVLLMAVLLALVVRAVAVLVVKLVGQSQFQELQTQVAAVAAVGTIPLEQAVQAS
jgi:hypothetical protein